MRDCGAAPDAEYQPHGRYCQDMITWDGEPDPDNPEIINYRSKLVLWPRGSFKSQVFNIGQVCWLVAKDPNIRILVCSEVGRQARKFVAEAMKIIHSAWFEERFGIHKGEDWKPGSGSFKSALRTRAGIKDPTLQAAGVGEVQTGAHWDFVIMDDVCSQENTKTPESIEATWNWFGEIQSQLDPGTKLFMIGTLHHYADLYCKIMKDEELKKDFDISKYAWSNPVVDPAGKEPAELFFPTRLTRAWVASRKLRQVPRMYACFYENRPASADDQIFLPEYFHVVEDQDIPYSVWSYVLTDFAFTGGEKARDKDDRTVFWVISLDCHRVAYVRDIVFGRWKPSDSVRVLCRVWDQWSTQVHLKGISIEKTTHREMMQSLFEEVRRETMIRPKIIAIEGRSQEIKDMRIEASEPRYRRGDIYFARSLREQHRKWNPMIDEMTEWPFSAHDDIPDSQSDLDKKNQDGRFYLPGPPVGWRAAVMPNRFQPPMVDGRMNPEINYDPRSMVKMLQQRGVSDVWSRPTNKTDSFFRRPPQSGRQLGKS